MTNSSVEVRLLWSGLAVHGFPLDMSVLWGWTWSELVWLVECCMPSLTGVQHWPYCDIVSGYQRITQFNLKKKNLKGCEWQKDQSESSGKKKMEVVPVFLAEPWTPAPTAPLPGLPGAPVFLLNRLLKKLASTPSLAAPAKGHTRSAKSVETLGTVQQQEVEEVRTKNGH